MRVVAPASEDDMVAAFLRAEVGSPRFGPQVLAALAHEGRGGAFEVVEVQAEPACWRPYTGWYGDRRILKPDLSLTLGLGKWRLHWFVEIDRATEHRPALARKLAAYETAWRGGGEQYRRGVFPGVCWVVPDKARAAVVEEMCAKSGAPDQMFTVTTPNAAVRVLTLPLDHVQ
jgi:hypothetical protein